MFDLGIQELVMIFLVALVVFGPKRLPELARNMGKGVAELKKAMFEIRHEIDNEMSETTGMDLGKVPGSSGDLKKALGEKAMEAAGLKDGPMPEGLGSPPVSPEAVSTEESTDSSSGTPPQGGESVPEDAEAGSAPAGEALPEDDRAQYTPPNRSMYSQDSYGTESEEERDSQGGGNV